MAVSGQPHQRLMQIDQSLRVHPAGEIMKTRLLSFDLLLGGVPKVEVDADSGAKQSFISEVLHMAGERLEAVNRRLRL